MVYQPLPGVCELKPGSHYYRNVMVREIGIKEPLTFVVSDICRAIPFFIPVPFLFSWLAE